MSTGLANELQMLNKMVAVIIDSAPPNAPRIVNQGNSAYAMLVMRMLAGRMCEGWKVLSGFSKKLKADYEPHMSEDGRVALRNLRAYFNPGKGKQSLITDVRNNVAFHSLREIVAAAYDALPPMDDLGDYLHRHIGNTLYYTTEILQYEALKQLAGVGDGAEALRLMQRDAHAQTNNFNTAIYSFVVAFCERYLKGALATLPDETETFEVRSFDDMRLSFFSELPTPQAAS
ncbi:hypothetical protein TS85_00070 [Sphingomonas hengshuiensis]|uniref:Uncharacterized protein n=2 Tax=Sphingomonas hengshuiensis TaxID=1609977 RepID=A0A7U5CUI8_9SPHN|nr:hypothetical protein TS85_00070 [Sphingomonas hengshuiensis]